MRGATCAGTIAALLLAAPIGGASAQGWMQLPNGSWAYATDYTTSGMFTCGTAKYLLGSCLAQGNSVTLTNEQTGSSMTINFTGASSPLRVTGRPQQVEFGSFTRITSGNAPFTFPRTTHKTASVFTFVLNFTSATPAPVHIMRAAPYYYRGDHLRWSGWGQTPIAFAVEPPPPGAPRLFEMQYHSFEFPDFDTSDSSYDMDATAVVTPEPVTLVLVGSGALVVAGLRARRRRRHQEPSD